MTWGQLRFQLQTAAPGVSIDLLDAWLNARYEQVIEAGDWQGLKATGRIQTQAAYQSAGDTVTFTVGSNVVSGVGTAWTDAITGMQMYRPGDAATYTVQFVAVGQLALDRPYEGNGTDSPGTIYPGAAYVFMQNVYALPADCGTVDAILDPVTELPLKRFSPPELDDSAGPRCLVNDPTSYAVTDDSAEANPPVLHQVEFFPPPLRARGFPVKYQRSAYGFDGENTAAGPLPFVSMSVLLFGCRADVAAYQEKPAMAAYYEGLFDKELTKMLRLEHTQRRKKVPMRMATRFTRHRLQRASRGYNNYWGPGQGGPN